ncbi:MAG: glycosyl hydrolase family 25 [Prevotella sp.]|nr:glycosyl hydrolase family 25 [Prevotella sp.]
MKRKLLLGCMLSPMAIIVMGIIFWLVAPSAFNQCLRYLQRRCVGIPMGNVDARKVEVDGIDVSHHNGTIDWPKVASNKNIKFAYLKATEGSTHRDRRFKRNAKEARRAGLDVGAYHFLTNKSAVKTQFEHFRKTTVNCGMTLIPMLDVEEQGLRGSSLEDVKQMVAEFCQLCEKRYGRKPVIYGPGHYFKKGLARDFANYYIWGSNFTGKPNIGRATKLNIWQFTERGRVDGICGGVDLNRFENGMTIEKLRLK